MSFNAEEIKKICAREFLIPFEGTGPRDKQGNFLAYVDPSSGGEPITISYGLTFDENGVKVKLGDVWTPEKAMRAKEAVLNTFLLGLLKLSPVLYLENSRRVAAVLSWCYNCGLRNYRISTFKKRVDEQDWEGAAEECLKWDRGNGKVMKGLTRRRQAEAKAILNP